MAFKQPEDKGRQPAPGQAPRPIALAGEKISKPVVTPKPAPAPKRIPERLVSLDAYRGFTMLLLASGGLAIEHVVEKHPEILKQFDGKWLEKPWSLSWQWAAAQLQHAVWTGCTVWDLIQPSFMFMVGVAMPFSYAGRAARGDSWAKQFGHALARSIVLILLGIFLRSTGSSMTNFTFEDVVTQIGLGYLFAFLLLRTPFWTQLLAVLAILGGYWFYFYHFPLPPPDGNAVTRYLTDVAHKSPEQWNQFKGLAAHWNKYTNAAAEFDRVFLNYFPRPEKPWEGKKFWINGGGYQTLNFVPSLVTMIFGMMAGTLLRGPRTGGLKLRLLIVAGAICFIASMGIDTTIWPYRPAGLDYSFCPIVKRIWTPSWAVFSAGWTFWFLAAFYWFVDLREHRRLALPLAIVGMNSIAVYCMVELMEGWLSKMLNIHLATVDDVAHTSLVKRLTDPGYAYAPIWAHAAVALLIWLICLWLYRRRLFIRV